MNGTADRSSCRFVLLMVLFAGCFCGRFVFGGPPWEEVQKLHATDGAMYDILGYSLASDGKLIISGAPGDDDNGSNSGSAYVFDVATGQQLLKLLPTDGSPDDSFGRSVALSGNLAVVGAYLDNDYGMDSGSAYVFDLTTGQELFKLNADNERAGDRFGYSVALSGSLAVIGSPYKSINNHYSFGTAYVFDVTTGQQLFKLTASDAEAGDEFGWSIAINGNVAIIGAIFGNNDAGYNSGSAYVFDLNTGQQLIKLSSADGMPLDFFGNSVALNGNIAVIGAEGDLVNGNDTLYGSAYIFDISTGQQLFKILAADGTKQSYFGHSVSISGNLALIGSYEDSHNGRLAGSAYLFDADTGQQLYKLLAADGNENDEFGVSTAIIGNLAVIGAWGVSDNYDGSGAVYTFQPLNITDLLTVSPDPLIAGQNGIFSISQALPDQTTWIIYSLDGLMPSYFNSLNVSIDIANPKVAGPPRSTDANGDLQVVLPIKNIPRQVSIWFQAVQRENSTNYVATEILP